MKYIVLDLEWNQPRHGYMRVDDPILLNGEIVQFGAVMLNEELEETDSFEMKVKPVFYKEMKKDVAELTGITDKILAEEGKPFAEAAEAFRKWCGDDSILLTWGPCDIDMLEDNLEMHGMDYQWIPEYFDAQLMFDDQETMEGRCFSLDYAMYYFKLRGIKGHDALNDARDTAAVIKELDLDEFIEEERKWREEMENEEEFSD